MKTIKVMEERRSVRDFRSKEFSSDLVNEIMKMTKEYPKTSDDVELTTIFMEDGESVYKKLDGVAGYNGVMISAPHYLLLVAEGGENIYQTAGYAGEWMVLNLVKKDIGSCWIEVSDKSDKVKDLLGLEVKGELIALLAVGYPDFDPRISNIYETKKHGSVSTLTELGYPNIEVGYSDSPVSNRISIEDLVFLKKYGVKTTVEELEKRGLSEAFFYMRLAPSWGNRQPWRFVLDGLKIVLIMDRDEKVDDTVTAIEAGIAMLYFEVAMHDLGYPGSWEVDNLDGLKDYDIPEDNYIAGYYTF